MTNERTSEGGVRQSHLAMLDHGIPVIVCSPHEHHQDCNPKCDQELNHPPGWQRLGVEQARDDIVNYRPGTDTYAVVTGHGVDAIDVDTKNGAVVQREREAAESFGAVIVGINETPSGGAHLFVASTGIATAAKPVNGVDFRGGCMDGTGRGLIYLPGAHRPKYRGRDYAVRTPIDWRLLDTLDLLEQREALKAYLTSRGINPRTESTPVREPIEPEPVDRRTLPRHLLRLLKGPVEAPDRSDRLHHLVGECYRAGLSEGQTVTVISPWCATVSEPDGKYIGQASRHVALSWPKIAEQELGQSLAPRVAIPVVPPVTVDQAKVAFREWLGSQYDIDAMLAVVSVAACVHLDGDTPWLLVVSGSGFTKTETVTALGGAGALVTSTITSEGALLSATSRKERSKNATGGLLRQVGDAGILVIKDVTSILSMGRELRAQVLAALREVADGFWERNVGTDGGQTLGWSGRCVTVGAVTTAWDTHHQVVAAMGDRFLLIRMDSNDPDNRKDAGRQALRTTSREDAMRRALSDTVAGLIAGMDPDRIVELTKGEESLLLGLADVATRIRTAVERDGHQKPEHAHALEAPTRLAKYLWQMVRGALALGVQREDAFRLAARVAGDCMPPLRKRVLLDVRGHPHTTVAQSAARLQLPWSTVDRAMQELHLLGALVADKETHNDDDRKGWRYECASVFNEDALAMLINPGSGKNLHQESQ